MQANNKALMQAIFSELAQGNGRPLVDAMADDFCWTFKSEGPWRGSYRGKQAVREELLGPLMAQFADRYTNTAQRFIAEGEHVVIECQGRVNTSPLKRKNRLCVRVWQGRNLGSGRSWVAPPASTATTSAALPGPHPAGRGGSRRIAALRALPRRPALAAARALRCIPLPPRRTADFSVSVDSGRPALPQPVLLRVPARRRPAQGAHRVHGHRAGPGRAGAPCEAGHMSGGDSQGRRQPANGGLLRIGELAALSGRSVHAIRWYETQGLKPNVARDAAGRRVYHARHLDWLQLMDRLRRTGMSIAEMRQYTDLVRQGRASLRQRKDLLLAHRARAQATIAEWLQALELIDGKIAFYDEWIGTGQPPRVLPHEQARPAALTAPTCKPKRRRASKD